jgi:Arc/MetJ family transcription regulator
MTTTQKYLTGSKVMCMIESEYTHRFLEGNPMRTNIVIDDKLMQQALQLSGLKTKREVVEQSLKLLITMERQKQIRALRGTLSWEGDLNAMRSDT